MQTLQNDEPRHRAVLWSAQFEPGSRIVFSLACGRWDLAEKGWRACPREATGGEQYSRAAGIPYCDLPWRLKNGALGRIWVKPVSCGLYTSAFRSSRLEKGCEAVQPFLCTGDQIVGLEGIGEFLKCFGIGTLQEGAGALTRRRSASQHRPLERLNSKTNFKTTRDFSNLIFVDHWRSAFSLGIWNVAFKPNERADLTDAEISPATGRSALAACSP